MRINAALRNTLADDIDAAVGSTGFARWYNAAGALLLASAALSNPAFDNAAAGVITLDISPLVEDTTPAAAGTCVRLGIYPASTGAYATDIFMLGVATGGTPDVTMANNVIATTDTVQLASLTVTVPSGAPDDT